MVLAGKTKKIFDGRYEVLGIVGRGSRSVVYHAQHALVPSSEVALKVLLQNKDVESMGESLRREALAMVSSRHKYVVRLDDFRSIGDLCYLAMEFAPEKDLRIYSQKFDGKLDSKQSELFLTQAAEALSIIHKAGIVHRDIKPDNILVISDKELRIADFGVALLPGEKSSIEQLRAGIGTLDYMAPEVLEGKEFTPKADIYSLGITFYEVLSGEHPFKGVNMAKQIEARRMRNIPNLESLCPESPKNLCQTIMKMIEFDPKNRLGSAQEISQYLVLAKSQQNKKNQKPAQAAPATNEGNGVAKTETQPANTEDSSVPDDRTEAFDIFKELENLKQESRISFGPAPIVQTNASAIEEQSVRMAIGGGGSEVASQNASIPRPSYNDSAISVKSQSLQQESAPEMNYNSRNGSVEVQAQEEPPVFQIGDSIQARPTEIAEDPFIGRLNKKQTVTLPEGTLAQIRAEVKSSDGLKFLIQQRLDRFLGLLKGVQYSRALRIVLASVLILFVAKSLFAGKSSSDKKPGDIAKKEIQSTVTQSKVPVFSATEVTFPILPSGMFTGVIRDLLPQTEFPFAILSIPEKRQLVVIVGIDGWVPSAISTEKLKVGDRIRVASNGIVLDLTGQFIDGELLGYFRNIITGAQGDWKTKPVKPRETK